jgi:hypothetical protein
MFYNCNYNSYNSYVSIRRNKSVNIHDTNLGS